MTLYASLDYTKSIMGTLQQAATPSTISDVKVLKNLRQVSQRADRIWASRHPVFAPWNETLKPLVDPQKINSLEGTFTLPRPLLALTGATSINGVTVATEGYPDPDLPPFTHLRLTAECADWYSAVCVACSTPRKLSIPGIWGFSSDYANAWLAVDAVTTTAITTTTATTFTVASAAGNDVYGQPYRISPGHLLKIDDEYLEVTGVSTNTVTVIRGANGSTAATHLIAAPVYRWEVETDIQRAVARQAGLFYARNGAYTTVEVQGMSEVRYPADFLQEVWGVVQGLAYV